MPLKLPGPIKHLLSRKHKSGTKRDGRSKKAPRDKSSRASLPASSPQDEGPEHRPSCQELREFKDARTHPESRAKPVDVSVTEKVQNNGGQYMFQYGANSDTCRLKTSRQISDTSDYTSMTPESSLESGTYSRCGNPASASALSEGLPDLRRHCDLRGLDRPQSVDSSTSFDSGVPSEYPQVRVQRHIPATSLPGKATSSPGTSLTDIARGGLISSPSVPVCSRRGTSEASRSAATAPVSRRDVEDLGARSSPLVGPFSGRGMNAEQAELEGELFPESALDLPIGALRKSRKRLCLMLNIEQPAVETEWTPDYMGLADMLGFEALEIQNFWERNPSDTLFLEWARSRDSRLLRPVLATLVQCLERIGRQDILLECRGLLLEDVSDYIAEKRLLEHYTVGRLEKFDCYVNIAEQDLLGIGREILANLEGVHNLRLCLTLRDVTLGGFEYEEMATMLETRCDSKVLIVLSKSYEDSDACQFLTQFAVTLDPGSRKNKLIPLLVDEDTYIPRVLRCLAMLNYHRDKRLGFLWPRLSQAIRA